MRYQGHRRGIVYGLRDPRCGCIRYIGGTTRPNLRLAMHLSEARSGRAHTHKINWLRLLQSQGLSPEFVPLNTGLWTNAELDAFERQMINAWRERLIGACCTLTNHEMRVRV